MASVRRTGKRAGDASAGDSPGADERIAVGIIRKPHGVRGEASVEPWTDSPDRFSELHDVLLVSPDESETRPSRIESTRTHAGRALVKFNGIDSPEDLQAVRNWTIEIPRTDSRPLERDEYFLHDLVGLSAEDPAGLPIGSIVDAYEGGGGILLTVETPEGGSFDVPFASAICTEIDLAGKRVVMVLPGGLDDLAAVPAVEALHHGSFDDHADVAAEHLRRHAARFHMHDAGNVSHVELRSRDAIRFADRSGDNHASEPDGGEQARGSKGRPEGSGGTDPKQDGGG